MNVSTGERLLKNGQGYPYWDDLRTARYIGNRVDEANEGLDIDPRSRFEDLGHERTDQPLDTCRGFR
jgi:hypothetical protein